MIVYDYESNPVSVCLPDKDIATINVVILSGDETGIVEFTDGTSVPFDSSSSRFQNFYDGSYTVSGEDIKRWLGFKPTKGSTASYQRQWKFL